MGHSAMVAQKHYWRVTDADFEKATAVQALHNPVQSEAVTGGMEQRPVAVFAGNHVITEEFNVNQYTPQESNL